MVFTMTRRRGRSVCRAAGALALGLLLSCPALAGGTASASDGGKVLNIYCWNEEFQSRFNDYYAKRNPEALRGVTVNWIITPNQDNAYQDRLDAGLLRQDSVPADERIDLFLVEPDYALRYVDTPYVLDVRKDVGLAESDLAGQFAFAKQVVTDRAGVLKGVTWQACPGVLIYRRSIAKAVLGTDDPGKVQESLSSWAKFNEVAALAAGQGYRMVSGHDDDFRVFSGNRRFPWVTRGKITVDDSLREWIWQTKVFAERGYSNGTSLWEEDWRKGMERDAKVFCYFGPSWFYGFCMPHTFGGEEYADGDWAVCLGPQGFFWGGSWLCAAAGTDNISLVRDIMRTLTCDEETMTRLARETGDFANNEKAMLTIAASGFKDDFLGGQNPYPWLILSAKTVGRLAMTAYDPYLDEKLQSAMKDYFDGRVTLEKAWENFYRSAEETFPALTR